MNPGHPRFARDRGFTLVELVVAMTIFAIIAVIAQQSMLSAMAQSSQLSKHSSDLAELELSVTLVTRDLENIAARAIRTGKQSTEPPLVLGENGRRLSFTRSGVHDPTGRARSPFERVAYIGQNDTETVQRQVFASVDRPEGGANRSADLWEGITAARFRVYAEGQWHETWPPADPGAQVGLPDGIAVVLETEFWGPIQRVVALR